MHVTSLDGMLHCPQFCSVDILPMYLLIAGNVSFSRSMIIMTPNKVNGFLSTVYPTFPTEYHTLSGSACFYQGIFYFIS